MTRTALHSEQIEHYDRDGFLIGRDFFDTEEVSKLYRIAIEDSTFKAFVTAYHFFVAVSGRMFTLS